MEQIDELVLPDAAAWREWLEQHEDDTPEGVHLVLVKKGKSAPTTLTFDQALEEALCSGWIDAIGRRRDDATSLQRFTPRRARSTWSARNVDIVGELIAQGRMRPRGQAEIDRAKADGRWAAAYQGSRTITVPDDLAAALAASPSAAAAFERLSSQNRYAILFRLHHLKTAEARVRNIAKYVAMLEAGETIHPQSRPGPD
ncbi:MAG: YdeI/OmpD-associated family protein [Propionibacteriaceae bacterium]|nr:YdeI/OmpD-associated family protein [Propionibacteriaceae bacterium]